MIRRTSVPPTAMSKDHRPHHYLFPQLHSLDPPRSQPSGVPRRWHRRCLTDRHRERWSDDRRIPSPGASSNRLVRIPSHRRPGRSPVRRRIRVALAPAMGWGRSRGTVPPRNSFVLFNDSMHRPSCRAVRSASSVKATTPDFRLRSAAAPLRRVDTRSGGRPYGRR